MADGSGDEFSLPSVRTVDDLFGVDETHQGLFPVESLTGGRVEQAVDVPGKNSAIEPSHVDFNHAVGAAWNSLPTAVVEPVWNSGFWKCIFGEESLGDNLEHRFKRPLPVPGISGGSDSAVTDAETLKKQCLIRTVVGSEPFFSKLCQVY